MHSDHPFFANFYNNSTTNTHQRLCTDPVPSYDDELSASPASSFLSSFATPQNRSHPAPDSQGQRIGDYVLGPIIAYGGSSTIRTAHSPSSGTVAVKIVKHSVLAAQSDAKRKLAHEAAVWASLSHEHILPLFRTESVESYAEFFVTLYCPAGSLFDILKRDGNPMLPQDDAGMMFRQVVRGLRYMHDSVGLVHRDLKLENVLVDEFGTCKIADFGMTVKIGDSDYRGATDIRAGQEAEYDADADEENRPISRHPSLPSSKRPHDKSGHLPLLLSARHRTHSLLPPTAHAHTTPPPPREHEFQPGSLPYAAPELLKPQLSATRTGAHPAQDIWALGVMLYALLTGFLPFQDAFEPRLQMKILKGTYEMPADIGRSARRVLEGTLAWEVGSRWSIGRVDDVAWGIGWGVECEEDDGDDIGVGENENELEWAAVEDRSESASSDSTASEPSLAEVRVVDDHDRWEPVLDGLELEMDFRHRCGPDPSRVEIEETSPASSGVSDPVFDDEWRGRMTCVALRRASGNAKAKARAGSAPPGSSPVSARSRAAASDHDGSPPRRQGRTRRAVRTPATPPPSGAFTPVVRWGRILFGMGRVFGAEGDRSGGCGNRSRSVGV